MPFRFLYVISTLWFSTLIFGLGVYVMTIFILLFFIRVVTQSYRVRLDIKSCLINDTELYVRGIEKEQIQHTHIGICSHTHRGNLFLFSTQRFSK